MSASSKKQLRKEQNAAQLTEKQLAEQKEAKKLKIYTVSFVAVIALILVVAVGLLINGFVNQSGVVARSTKAVTIGEHTLTSAEMNYFYVDYLNETYSNWSNSYGDYTDMYIAMLYGVDPTKSLQQQIQDKETGKTWGEYFAELAVADAAATYAMYDKAVAEGHTLTEAEEASIESTITNSELYATVLYGFSNLNEYLKAIYGNGASEKTFREYITVATMAQSYYNAHSESLSYDDAALREYEADRYNEFSSYSFSTFYVNYTKFVTGGTTDEEGNTTYTDEEKDAGRQAAKEAAEALAASGATDGLTLDKFIGQLDAYKDDETAVSSKNEDLLLSNINEDLVEWLSDEARTVGEVGVIPYEYTTTDADGKETTVINGYYVIVFEGRNDNLMNLVNVRHILVAFEGGTTDSTTGVTTYTEEEKQKPLDAINAVKAAYEGSEMTEEAFAALVADNSDDTGSTSNGGLYEDVYPGQMVEAFNDWCFDENRQPGDVDVVETEYGYHLMYYVGQSETTFRDFMIESELHNSEMQEWYNAIVEPVKATDINLKHLTLDYVMSNTSN